MEAMSEIERGRVEAGQDAATFDKRYMWVVLAILFLINMVNYMDRFIMSILVEPVRKEFGLSDTEAGLLTGLGFALVYGLLILPVARLSDRFCRNRLLALAVAAWSVLTTLCGAATSFTTLLLARAGVGVGEAAGLPASHSLASDFFPSRQRAMALAVIGLGGTVGSTLGLLIGGVVSQHYGWRHAFFAAGLPGIVLALVVFLFLREPPRGLNDTASASAKDPPPPFLVAVKLLLRRKAYVHIVAGVTLASIALMGITAWMPAFFMRVHHVPPASLSLWMTFAQVCGSYVGTLASGWACTRLYRPDGSMLLTVMSISFGVSPALALVVFLAPDTHVALIVFAAQSFAMSLWLSPYYTSQQELAGARYRATASAFGLIFFNVIGAGLGPLIVGSLSDVLATRFGDQSLRYAMAICLIFCLWGLAHIRVASRTMAADVADARS